MATWSLVVAKRKSRCQNCGEYILKGKMCLTAGWASSGGGRLCQTCLKYAYFACIAANSGVRSRIVADDYGDYMARRVEFAP